MKARLLLADGDSSWTELYQAYFSRNDYTVDTASSGLECLRKLQALSPDVLVLDVDLPWGGADGVLTRLHEETDIIFPLAVILTAQAAPPHMSGVLQDPRVNRCVHKPFHIGTLHACIRSCTGNGLVTGRAQIENVSKERACPKPLLLIADDDDGVREMLEMALSSIGFAVLVATNGRQAVDLYREHSSAISAVLLDVQMPELDGPKALKTLKNMNPQLPACLMTGDPGDYALAELGQADRVFLKPFHLLDVAQAIRRLLPGSASSRWLPRGIGAPDSETSSRET